MENNFLSKERRFFCFAVILLIFLLSTINLPLVTGYDDPGPITHKECVEGICKEVAGSGRNTCKYDSQCSHKECVNGRCERVIGQGINKCNYQKDCEEKCSCMACVGGCDPGCKMKTFYGDECPCVDDCSECGGEGPDEPEPEIEEETETEEVVEEEEEEEVVEEEEEEEVEEESAYKKCPSDCYCDTFLGCNRGYTRTSTKCKKNFLWIFPVAGTCCCPEEVEEEEEETEEQQISCNKNDASEIDNEKYDEIECSESKPSPPCGWNELSGYSCPEGQTCWGHLKPSDDEPSPPPDSGEDEEECTDSDGGKNYYVKGTVEGKSDEYYAAKYGVETREFVDVCSDAADIPEFYGLLIEGYCDENGFVQEEEYYCPNGCKDGACIEEPMEHIKIEGNYIFLSEKHPDGVYSSHDDFYTGVLSNGNRSWTLINFDLNSLKNKKIKGAELVINKVYLLEGDEYGKQAVAVHKVMEKGDFNTASWNNKPSFDTTPVSSQSITGNGEYTFDVTSIINYLISDDKGVLLKAHYENEPNLKRFDKAYLDIWYIE